MKRKMPQEAKSFIEPEPGDGRREWLARACHRARMLPILGRLRDALGGGIRILAYHRVIEAPRLAGFEFDVDLVSATPEAFHDQMSSLRRNFHPIRFDDLLDCIESGRKPPKRAVLISFDDGYDDNYHTVFPILRDLGMSAMFFVSTGHIDSGAPYTYDWLVHMLRTTAHPVVAIPELGMQLSLPDDPETRRDEAAALLGRIKSLDALGQEGLVRRLELELDMPRSPGQRDCQPMDWRQLREMQAGGMEIGSHGVHHRMLGRLPASEMSREVRESKTRLECELGTTIDVLSYPVGGRDAFSDDVIAETRAAGYRMACSYITGVSRLDARSRYAMPRLPVEVMDPRWFEAMMAVPEVFSYPLGTRAGS